MPPRFNTARLSVEVGGLDLPALALSGTEGFSQPFRYILDILAPPGFYAAELLDLPARITLAGCDGSFRILAGIVTAIKQQNPHPDGRCCFRLTVESALARLRMQHDTRIFLQQDVPQIIETVLAAHGISEDRLCRIRLASEQGAVSLQARKTQRFQSGDTLTEHSGNDRSHTIEQHHHTVTRSAEIHHQAHTDHQHKAKQNLNLDAGHNLEMTSAGLLRFDLQRGQKLTVNGTEATFSVRDGEIHIQAAQDLEIQGQGGGDISFGQNGSGFVVTAGGDGRIFGNRVSFGGQGGASLSGPVNYQIGAAEPMSALEVGRTLKARGIAALRDQKSPAIFNLAWERQFVPVGEAVDLFFTVKNFQGGETAQVRVFERDADGSSRQIDALHCLLEDGFGHYRLPWSRSGAQAQEDLLHDANALDPSPLTYLFDVRVGDIHSENSPSLHLTTRLYFTPRDWGAPSSRRQRVPSCRCPGAAPGRSDSSG